jgi:hypothetical protein
MEPDRPDDGTRKRLNIAIGVAALCAAAAIGLGIWGFAKQSDLDDANATIARQKTELAQQRATAADTLAGEQKFGQQVAAQYRATRRKLLRSDKTTAQLRAEVSTQQAQYVRAQQNVANAKTAAGRVQAQLDAARQQQDLTAACARGALDSLDLFFKAASAKSGAKQAVAQLKALDNQCASAVQG